MKLQVLRLCPWPFIQKADGLCKECGNGDVGVNCVPGQAIATDSQDSCICQKCVEGWIGSQCDIQVTVAPPTENPVATLSPTKAPTTLTLVPTKAPTIPEGCYSINYKDCLPDVASGDEFCNKIWLPTGAKNNCASLGSQCASNQASCCEPAQCFAESGFAICVPPSDSTSTPTKAPASQSPSLPACIVCDDEPTSGMKKKGNSCTDINLTKKCNKNASWIKKGYCQLSCYNEGLGYDGDVCCTDDSTSTPTKTPAFDPTFNPTKTPAFDPT